MQLELSSHVLVEGIKLSLLDIASMPPQQSHETRVVVHDRFGGCLVSVGDVLIEVAPFVRLKLKLKRTNVAADTPDPSTRRWPVSDCGTGSVRPPQQFQEAL